MQARAKRTPARRQARTGPAAKPTATRDRIVEAALEAFADFGFDGATTRDIAAAAGVNQGLITYHFAGKEELWKATVEHVFDQLRASFAALQILDDVDPLTRLRLAIRQFVRFTAAHPELHRLMVQESKSEGPRQRWLVDRHVKPLFELTVEMIRQAQRDGVLIDVPAPQLYYLFLGAAAHVFVVAPEFRRLTGEDPMKPESVETHADALIELMMRRRTS